MSFWYEICCDNNSYTETNHVIVYFTAKKSTKLEPSFGLVVVLQFYWIFSKKINYFWLGTLTGFNLEWVQGCANAGGNMGKTTWTYARYMKLFLCSLFYFGFFINLFVFFFSISNIKTSLTLHPVHRECTKKAKISRNQTTMINQQR